MIDGRLTIGQFALFNTLLLQLVWPLEALGWIINLGQRAIASASRSFAWLEGVDTLPEPESPRALPEGPLPVRFEDVRFGYAAEGERCCAASTSRSSRARSSPSAARRARARRRCSTCCPASTTRPAGRVLIGGVDARDVPLAELRDAVAIVTQRPILFSVPLRDNLLAGRP